MMRGVSRGIGRRRFRGGSRNPWTVFLVLQFVQRVMESPDKPPATLGLVLANVLVYLHPQALAKWLPTLESGCLDPSKVLWKREWTRIITSAFLHMGDHHLYYNMASLFYKGTVLERELGTKTFSKLVAFLLMTSHTMYVGISYLLYRLQDGNWMYKSAAGFSGVLFGLKVILHSRSHGHQNVFGFRVSSRWASWVELAIVQMIFPRSSLLGHACGILAGLLWLKGGQFREFLPFDFLSTRQRFQGHGYARRGGATQSWEGELLDEQEQLERAVAESLQLAQAHENESRRSSSREAGTSGQNSQPNANELRRRRLQFYSS